MAHVIIPEQVREIHRKFCSHTRERWEMPSSFEDLETVGNRATFELCYEGATTMDDFYVTGEVEDTTPGIAEGCKVLSLRIRAQVGSPILSILDNKGMLPGVMLAHGASAEVEIFRV